MRSAARSLLVLVCLAAAVPAAALAHRPATIAPPGDSAITQYVEDIPTAQGPTPTQPGHGGARAALPAGLTGRSARGGAVTRDLAASVAATAPVANGGVTRSRAHGHGPRVAGHGGTAEAGSPANRQSNAAGPALSPAAVQSPGSLLADAAIGGGGLGILLGLVLLASLVGAVAVRVYRGRQRP